MLKNKAVYLTYFYKTPDAVHIIKLNMKRNKKYI
jgi:hypothetical protein